MKCKHATREIPTDPHGKARYERAMRHMELAKNRGCPVKKYMLYLSSSWILILKKIWTKFLMMMLIKNSVKPYPMLTVP